MARFLAVLNHCALVELMCAITSFPTQEPDSPISSVNHSLSDDTDFEYDEVIPKRRRTKERPPPKQRQPLPPPKKYVNPKAADPDFDIEGAFSEGKL